MKKKASATLAALLAAGWAHACIAAAIDPVCEKQLPAAAVGAVVKKKVELVPKDPAKGAGGTCNYAAGGAIVLLMNVDAGGKAAFDRYHKSPMYKTGLKDLPGVGEEAFSSGPDGNIVAARKGNTVVVLSSFMDANGDWVFKRDQLAALARQALK